MPRWWEAENPEECCTSPARISRRAPAFLPENAEQTLSMLEEILEYAEHFTS